MLLIYSDPSVTDFQESADAELQQDVSTTVSIDVEITNSAATGSGNNILGVSSGNNFHMELQLSDVDMASNSDSLGLSATSVTADTPAKLQQALATSASDTISITADVTIPQSDCENIHFLCVILSEGTGASFHDADSSNNIRCKNIDAQKGCDPGES